MRLKGKNNEDKYVQILLFTSNVSPEAHISSSQQVQPAATPPAQLARSQQMHMMTSFATCLGSAGFSPTVRVPRGFSSLSQRGESRPEY